MSDQRSLGSGVQVLRVEDIDDELLEQIMKAKWGEVSDEHPGESAVKDEKDASRGSKNSSTTSP